MLRHPVAFEGTLTGSDGLAHRVHVEDFSLNGCCVRDYLAPGELVVINLPRMGRFEAEVRWGRGGRAGLCFRRSIGAH